MGLISTHVRAIEVAELETRVAAQNTAFRYIILILSRPLAAVAGCDTVRCLPCFRPKAYGRQFHERVGSSH
jgi:hypothetical protein